MQKIEFWFEFASTYSYLSVLRIEDMAARHDVQIVWRPFLLGPIFAAQGWTSSPFNLFPVKGAYMWRDMERLCSERGAAFVRPAVFPQNGLWAARVAQLALTRPEGPEFCKAVYTAQFADGRDIGKPDTIAKALAACGLPASLLEEAGSPANKAALKASTEEAVAKGLFGAPSFLARGEVFWGDDRLEQALEWAAG